MDFSVYRSGPVAGFRILKIKTLCKKIKFRNLQVNKILQVKKKNKIPESPGEQNSPGEKKLKKPYSTRDSLVVPYQSTDLAQRCLTSQFGWDAVLSPWYDRMTRSVEKINTPDQKIPESPGEKKKKKPYSTRDSLVVPYQSTDLAQRCLTSQFGWDAVLSPWYDRMTKSE